MYFFGLGDNGAPNPNSSTRGLLVMNHEAPNPFNTGNGTNNLYIHANGATTAVVSGVATRTVPDECVKEINHHGVSIIEVQKVGATWSVNRMSTFNRRITAATTMEISGPLRGNDALKTKFSPTGTQTQGTVNNCANGFTPWGTYLTCEENWAGYFARAADDNAKRSAAEVTSLNRYGNAQNAKQRLNWNTAGAGDEFQRWDASVKTETAAGDFRNAINQFGYVVEIDPFNPSATPRKRTALGRFAHEGCWPSRFIAGQKLAFYMGDDNRGDYIYKFVTNANWDPADATASQTLATDRLAIGTKYLDSGTLYVARFNADGTGTWLPLSGVEGALNTRLAADAAGATRMDRPEWAAVNPASGEVYVTLTNNNAANRLVSGTPTGNAALTDPANPRAYKDTSSQDPGAMAGGNPNGHIIRFRENGDSAAATAFTWDIFLFGARASANADNINVSGLTDSNDFSSPDGLWFGRTSNAAAGLLWIETDDAAYLDTTNPMLLAAVPGSVGDGAAKSITSTIGDQTRTVTTKVGKALGTALRRFLVGPKQAEITGIDTTPDGKTLFVNIQHPGEDKAPTFNDPSTFGSHWPGNQFGGDNNARPRSSTIVITKNDGGVIGI
jgi:secreted PhoX family phosphatase